MRRQAGLRCNRLRAVQKTAERGTKCGRGEKLALVGRGRSPLGPRPFREAELAAYLRREHRGGRRLGEILNDPYIGRCGGQSVLWAVLRRPSLIQALRQDVADAFAQSRPPRSSR